MHCNTGHSFLKRKRWKQLVLIKLLVWLQWISSGCNIYLQTIVLEGNKAGGMIAKHSKINCTAMIWRSKMFCGRETNCFYLFIFFGLYFFKLEFIFILSWCLMLCCCHVQRAVVWMSLLIAILYNTSLCVVLSVTWSFSIPQNHVSWHVFFFFF